MGTRFVVPEEGREPRVCVGGGTRELCKEEETMPATSCGCVLMGSLAPVTPSSPETMCLFHDPRRTVSPALNPGLGSGCAPLSGGTDEAAEERERWLRLRERECDPNDSEPAADKPVRAPAVWGRTGSWRRFFCGDRDQKSQSLNEGI